MRRTDTFGAGSGSDDFGDDDPTVVEDKHPTGPHDLSGFARISAARERDDIVRVAYSEGQEDAIRALYAVMRRAGRPLSRAEMDNLVLAVRQLLTQL